jgi:hypothetical protein
MKAIPVISLLMALGALFLCWSLSHPAPSIRNLDTQLLQQLKDEWREKKGPSDLREIKDARFDGFYSSVGNAGYGKVMVLWSDTQESADVQLVRVGSSSYGMSIIVPNAKEELAAVISSP